MFSSGQKTKEWARETTEKHLKEFCAKGRNFFVWEWSKTHYWHWININAHSRRNWKPESDLGFLVGFLAGMELLKMHELIHRGSGMYPALCAHVKYFQSAYCGRFALSAPLQRVWTHSSVICQSKNFEKSFSWQAAGRQRDKERCSCFHEWRKC